MAYELDLRIDSAQLDKLLSVFADDLKNRMRSGALNNLAYGIRRELQKAKRQDIDKPVPFTNRLAKIYKANAKFSRAKIETQPIQSDYLGWQVFGGTRKPKRRAIPLPRAVGVNKFGNMPRLPTGEIKLPDIDDSRPAPPVRKVKRPGLAQSYFIGAPLRGRGGRPYGPEGIYRAINKPHKWRRVYQMVNFKRSVKYDKKLRWFERAEGYFEANVSKETERAIKFVLSKL